MTIKSLVVCLACSIFTNLVSADSSLTASGKSLSMIMADPDWIGNPAVAPRFSDNGETVIYKQKRTGEIVRDYFEVNLATRETRKLTSPDAQFDERIFDHQGNHAVVGRHGNLFLIDFDTGKRTPLTTTTGIDSAARFMADGQRVVFERSGQQYAVNIQTGLITQLTDIRPGKDPAEKPAYSFLANQNIISTHGEVRRQERLQTDLRKQRLNAGSTGIPLPVYAGEDRKLISNIASTSGNYSLVVTAAIKGDTGPPAQMPNYVTDSGYVEFESVRTKVGENVPGGHQLLLVNLSTGEVTELDLSKLTGINKDPLVSLRKTALDWHVSQGANRTKIEAELEAPAHREFRVEGVIWNSPGTTVAVQLHSVDNKDRWLVTIDPEQPTVMLQHRLTDERWINYAHNDFGWMKDARTLWFLSEQSGYSHLFLKSIDKRRPQQLTKGQFIVESPVLSAAGDYFTVIANQDDAGAYAVFRVPVTGGMDKLTSLSADPQSLVGRQPFITSADGSRLLFRHSAANKPPEWYWQANQQGASAHQVTTTTSQQFSHQSWEIPEFVDIPSTKFDGHLRARVYTPNNKQNKLPIVVFVHGAGYLQNAHSAWSAYFREYMFNNLLVEQGYLVLDLDYRGSRGYGRNFRTAIYRDMGHPELEDLLDGIDWVAQNRRGDPNRVGVYGGSYGGFMALMAMFRAPDRIQVAAALRPVTDWSHYNHNYTSNILNTPLIDPVAYERSSPIYYAESFPDKPLLIAHGMQDDNVHVQDSVRLVQRLIELKKENFELALYPLDPHGFKHPTSWLDEYRRVFKLFDEHLR